MAKTGVISEGDSVRVLELKKELKLLLNAILEEDNFNVNNSNSSILSYIDNIDKATEILSVLKQVNNNNNNNNNPVCPVKEKSGEGIKYATLPLSLANKKMVSLRLDGDHDGYPSEFCCPLSKKLMRDPVIISTGQTYDRPFIQKWLTAGHRICPITQQVLSHSLLTPNFLVREMISEWCKSRGIETPDPVGYKNEEGATEADRDYFSSLIGKMSKSIGEQKAAAKELRLLTKRMPSFRALFGESTEAIPQLLRPLTQRRGSFSSGSNEIHPDLQEDLITTLLNISIHDSNKKLVAETPMVITLLIDALQCGTPETRSNAAAALFTLSALDPNKVLIGKSGALKPLIELLEEGHPMAVKDAASAIFNLCIIQENKARAVREGAVRVILKKIKNGVHVNELLAILAMLSTHHRAVEELTETEAVPCLLSIMRESSCSRNKENCIATLYTICVNDRTKLREMREEERAYGTLSQLAQDGTSRAKRKASGILERLNRALNLTHTA